MEINLLQLILVLAPFLLAVIGAWVDVRSQVHSLRVESQARHEENLRRFARLEGMGHGDAS